MKLINSNEEHIYFLLLILFVFVVIFLASDRYTDRKIKELEYKIQAQKADIEELYLRSDELFKRIK